VLSNASNDADLINDPDVGRFTVDANDPGQAGDMIHCGPLGMASGTPMDGNNEPFSRLDSMDEMVVENKEEPLDLTTTPSLFSTNPSMTDIVPPASTRAQFGRDTTHTYTASDPPGLPSSPGATAPSQANATSASANSGNDSNSDNNLDAGNNGGDAGGNDNAAGGTCNGDDPQNAGDDANLIEKIIFSYRMVGGPVSTWGLTGRFPARPVAYIENQLVAPRGRLIRSMFVDEVTALVHQAYGHNARVRVHTILNSKYGRLHASRSGAIDGALGQCGGITR